MSRLKELIEELCPCGVAFARIDELCQITRGRVMSKDYIRDNAGDYPVYSSQTENNGELGKISTFDYEGEFLTWTTDGANAGSVFYRNGKFSVTNVCGLLKIKNEQILIKYMYYALSITAPRHVSRGMGNPKLMSNAMGKIKIPVPPIEVQGEIINILDRFTELTEEIITELAEERTARKKQYEYYMEEMLNSDSKVKKVKLGEFATISRGGNFQKKDFCEVGVPCIHYGQIYTRYGLYANKTISNITDEAAQKSKFATKNDIIMAVTSENIEDVCKCVAWLGDDDIAISGHTAIINHNQNPKYLAYYFHTAMFFNQKRKLAQGTKVTEVTPSKLANIEIPIPTLEEQEDIVDKLDRLSEACNDITNCISVEIEARKKQYEYYRDKLLTFKGIRDE